MTEKQFTFTFTVTLDELQALSQSLDHLKQTILHSHDTQMRTIDLLEKWEHQPIAKPLNEKTSNDSKGAD